MNVTAEELRTLFLFDKLTGRQLAQLVAAGRAEDVQPGVVFAEGDPATCFYVLLSGTIAITKRSGGCEVELTRTDQRGAYAGGFTSAEADTHQPRNIATLRALTACRFYVIDADRFAALIRDWFPMALHLVRGISTSMRGRGDRLGQRERLLALGTLSAGLAHELNNPAAAAERAVVTLGERIAGMRGKLTAIAEGELDPAALRSAVRLQDEAVELAAAPARRSALEVSDAEARLADWLDDHDVAAGWDLAAILAGAGLDVSWADHVLGVVGRDNLDDGIRWLAYTVETESLLAELADAVGRITALVGAAKQYSQLDRAPYQDADLRTLLDATLAMMAGKLGGVHVVKDYDAALPPVPCYAAELNQVWTNLVDNAAFAMAGSGTLTVRARRDGDSALIEICDTGPGVPPEIRDRVFEPFFTTKAVGEGTGLGLDISWRIVVNRHGGDLSVRSAPGDTRFRVRLPLEPAGPDTPR